MKVNQNDDMHRCTDELMGPIYSMNAHTEFLLLFIAGFAASEYFVKRYFGLQDRRLWVQGIVLGSVLIIFTLKYLSFQTFVAVTLFTLPYCIAVGMLEKFLTKERDHIERFVGKTVAAVILFLILRVCYSAVDANGWFDSAWDSIIALQFHSARKILVYCIGYLFVLDGGTSLVKGILYKFPILTHKVLDNDPSNSAHPRSEIKNAGELIGSMERLLILTFVLVGNYQAVAFSVAAKSIARFKELEDKNFAEYYLIGTSVSVGVAVGMGILLNIIV